MPNHLSHIKTRFLRCEKGAISVMMAILLPVVIGFIALAADTGVWYVKQRNMQAATDVAAISAARDLGLEDYYVVEANVKSEGARNGFPESDGVNYTVNIPPTSGSYTLNNYAVEVELSQNQTRFFSALHMGSNPVATTRAVALKSTSGEACVLALSTNASPAISFQGNPDVELDGCVIASNSSDSCAITIGGSAASVEADSLQMVGDYCTSGNPTLDFDEPPVSGASAVDDPYADLPDPTYGSCNKNNYKAKNTETLNPGVYCNGLTINANADITLNPGTYYVTGGDLRINGGAEVFGDGVTIILTGSGSNVGSLTVNGSAELDLTAPSSGTYEGILFYQDRDAPSGTTNKLNGGSNNILKGTVYFPNQHVEFSGGSTGVSNCMRLVADTVKFGGNTSVSHDCDPVGGENVTTEESITLVE